LAPFFFHPRGTDRVHQNDFTFWWKQFEQQSRRQHPVGNPNRLFGPLVTRRPSYSDHKCGVKGKQEVAFFVDISLEKFTSHPPPDAV
jgi:hypothetical protein